MPFVLLKANLTFLVEISDKETKNNNNIFGKKLLNYLIKQQILMIPTHDYRRVPETVKIIL